MPLTIGSRLGHYDVTALIGEGGMGQVYRATDTASNRETYFITRNHGESEQQEGGGRHNKVG